MIYFFTYLLNDQLGKKTCYTLREAELFFDILISAKCTSIRVISERKRGDNAKIGN